MRVVTETTVIIRDRLLSSKNLIEVVLGLKVLVSLVAEVRSLVWSTATVVVVDSKLAATAVVVSWLVVVVTMVVIIVVVFS